MKNVLETQSSSNPEEVLYGSRAVPHRPKTREHVEWRRVKDTTLRVRGDSDGISGRYSRKPERLCLTLPQHTGRQTFEGASISTATLTRGNVTEIGSTQDQASHRPPQHHFTMLKPTHKQCAPSPHSWFKNEVVVRSQDDSLGPDQHSLKGTRQAQSTSRCKRSKRIPEGWTLTRYAHHLIR